MKCVTALVLIATFYVIQVSGGGFENFLCAKKNSKEKVYLPCSVDCQHNHGAVTGECPGVDRGDFNCKCKGRAKKVYDKAVQCTVIGDSLRAVCNVDCICQHGAKGGYCDWERKACICRGENDGNVNCPFKTIDEYIKYMYDTASYELGEQAFVRPVYTERRGRSHLSAE